MNRNSQIRMTNDEFRRNIELRMTNPAIAHLSALRHSGFGFLSSFVIRHSPVSDKFPSYRSTSGYALVPVRKHLAPSLRPKSIAANV